MTRPDGRIDDRAPTRSGRTVSTPTFSSGCDARPRRRPAARLPVQAALSILVAAAVLAAGLQAGPARAADARPSAATLSASLDALMAGAVRDGRVPGGVLLVAREGRVLHRRAYGLARVDGADGPEAMTPAHAFDMASLTKVFATTFAAMLLVDQGRLGLDEPAAAHVPAFARPGGPDHRGITVRQLLTHTSGLPAWCPLYLHAPSSPGASPAARRAAVLDCLAAAPLAGPPGAKRVYSDLGFILLGLVVESAAGRPLDAFLQESLYTPLGLARTGFRPDPAAGLPAAPPAPGPFAATSRGNPYEARMAADPAKGCACPAGSGGPPAPPGLPPRLDGPAAPLPAPPGGWRDHVLAGEANDGNCWHGLAGVAGHAGLFATADDLLVLADLLLNRGIGGLHAGRLFLSAGTVDLFLSQGLGWSADRPWFKAEAAPAGAVGHTGFTGTSVVLLPRERTAIILLTNRQQAGPDPQGRYPDLSALRSSVVAAVVQGIKQGGRP